MNPRKYIQSVSIRLIWVLIFLSLMMIIAFWIFILKQKQRKSFLLTDSIDCTTHYCAIAQDRQAQLPVSAVNDCPDENILFQKYLSLYSLENRYTKFEIDTYFPGKQRLNLERKCIEDQQKIIENKHHYITEVRRTISMFESKKSITFPMYLYEPYPHPYELHTGLPISPRGDVYSISGPGYLHDMARCDTLNWYANKTRFASNSKYAK